MQEFFFAFQVNEVVTRAQQRLQLGAGLRDLFALEGEAERFFPAPAADRGDLHVFDRADGVLQALFGFLDVVNDDGNVAEAHDVVGAHGPFARAEARAVEVRAVGAAEVADTPAFLREADLRVPTAHGGVFQNDFKRREPAGPQNVVRVPGLAFHLPVDATQPNATFHGDHSSGRLSHYCRGFSDDSIIPE
jgi:hypothetical protein